ncbi:MAG: MFS transporter [Candidatus Heimdallarchaeota archaeon]
MRKQYAFLLSLLFLPLFVPNQAVTAHEGYHDTVLDTGDVTGPVQSVLVGLGLLIFLGIIVFSIRLLQKPQLNIPNPKTYLQKINSFSQNARYFTLHIEGMSLTYGVRTVLFNIYLLYLFPDGIEFLGTNIGAVFFVGILLAIGSLVSGIISPFAGIFVDRIGKKWSFIFGDFCGAIMILIVILWPTPWVIIVAQIIRSAVMSIHNIAENPFIYEQSSDKERAYLFSTIDGMSTIAMMSGNLLGGAVPLGIALLLYQTAIVSGTAAVFVIQIGLLVSVALWLGSLIPAVFLNEDPALRKRAQESIKARMSFKNVTNWGTVGVFVLSAICIGLGAGMFVYFFSLFFLLFFNANPAEIAVVFALGASVTALGNFISPIIAEKFGKVQVIVGTRLLSLPFLLLLPFAPGLLIAAGFYLLRGFFMNATTPTESALAMEVVNDSERVTMEALRVAGMNIFTAVGFLLGSYMMDIGDFYSPFILASAFYLVAVLVFWAYFRNGRQVLPTKTPVPG